jgi:hypothetical protein
VAVSLLLLSVDKPAGKRMMMPGPGRPLHCIVSFAWCLLGCNWLAAGFSYPRMQAAGMSMTADRK